MVETADDPGAAPEARLRGLIAALLEAYRDADSQHNVQISSMRFLPAERQAKLKAMERDLVRIFSAAVAGVAPHLKGTKMLTPVTMSLFGMVNWHYLWFSYGYFGAWNLALLQCGHEGFRLFVRFRYCAWYVFTHTDVPFSCAPMTVCAVY